MKQVKAIDTQLLQIGCEVFPVFGNPCKGYSITEGDFEEEASRGVRYDSLDELWFALTTMRCMPEGHA